MPRDIDVIVRTLDTPDWVFLRPSGERVMQDEVHHDARAEIARRGMPPSTPYAGWHTQQHAAGRDGMLTRPQRVYFGGEPAHVRERLQRLEPHGFAVLGGRSADEAFVVARDARPTAAVVDQLPALRARLSLLADTELMPGSPVRLRTGEEELLHAVLRSPALAASTSAVLPDALTALHRRGLASTADVDAVVRGWREVFGDRAVELARVAVDLAHPFAEDLVLDLLTDGEAPSDLLVAWGDERAVEAARAKAVTGSARDVTAYLDLAATHGAPPRETFLALAELVRADVALRAPDPVGHDRLDTLAHLVTRALDADGPRALQLLAAQRDASLPAWLRAQVVTTHAMLPVRLRNELVRSAGGATRSPGRGPEEPAPDEAQTVVDGWDDAAREACAASGAAPWPGFGLHNRSARVWAHETMTDLAPWQVDALRAHLGRDHLGETEIATCLELLLVADRLRPEDVLPLRRGWRKRLFVKPDAYARARPAVVSLATVLLGAGDPTGQEIVDVVLADRRAWAAGPQHLLLAETGGAGVLERLWAAAMVDGPGGKEAASGWVLLDARTSGHSVGDAAARGWRAVSDPGPAWRRNRLLDAAICWADPHRPTWGSTHGTGSLRQVRAALDLAADERHPTRMRARALEVATDSSVLRRPAESEPVAVDAGTAAELRARAAATAAGLGVA